MIGFSSWTNQRLTYRQLYERSQGIADHLARLGLRAGERILLLFSPEEWIQALWTVLVLPWVTAPSSWDGHGR
jgi:non-ribosomal peptide synthetase component F